MATERPAARRVGCGRSNAPGRALVAVPGDRYHLPMARRIDDVELDPTSVLIADDVDSSPAAVSVWFERLKRHEPVNTTISAP